MPREFEMEGLDKIEKKFLEALKKNERLYETLLTDLGKSVLENAKENVGEDTGQLKAALELKPWPTKRGLEVQAEVERDKDIVFTRIGVFYAHMLNNGHEIVKVRRSKTKKGKVRRQKIKKGFVKGNHFYDKGLEKTRKQIPKKVEGFLKELFK